MNNKKKLIIAIIIIVVVITIAIVSFLIYKNKKKQKEDAAAQMAILQQQLSQPNIPVNQKQNILQQIAGLAVIIGSNLPVKNNQIPAMPNTNSTTPAPTVNIPAPAGFPLKNGSSSPYVQLLQKAINTKCGSGLSTDGKFGPKTESAALSCIGTKTVSWQQYQSLIGLYGS